MVAPDRPTAPDTTAAGARILEGLEQTELEQLVDVLTPEEKNEALVRLMADVDREYAREPWLWMAEQIITIDEASQERLPWPVDKTYLQELTHAIRTEPLLAVPKSRRMLVSWAVAAFCSWEARYYRNHAIFWQSEVERKAAFVIDKRCAFLEGNLRNPYLRRKYDAIRTTDGLIGRLTYRRTESYLLAIAQGGDVLRTYTPSRVVIDESEFQPEGPEALTAALPLVEKGAKLVVISTSNGPAGVLAGICKQIGFTRFS